MNQNNRNSPSPNDEQFQILIGKAREGDPESLGTLLEWYCHYLQILASTQLDHRLRRRVSPSDLVQETLLAAHRDFAHFRGNSQAELLGWLRQILIHRLHHLVDEHIKAGKRDIRREIPSMRSKPRWIDRQPTTPIFCKDASTRRAVRACRGTGFGSLA